jgi:hypothetical protein
MFEVFCVLYTNTVIGISLLAKEETIGLPGGKEEL